MVAFARLAEGGPRSGLETLAETTRSRLTFLEDPRLAVYRLGVLLTISMVHRLVPAVEAEAPAAEGGPRRGYKVAG
jgi:hypothetical protein